MWILWLMLKKLDEVFWWMKIEMANPCTILIDVWRKRMFVANRKLSNWAELKLHSELWRLVLTKKTLSWNICWKLAENRVRKIWQFIWFSLCWQRKCPKLLCQHTKFGTKQNVLSWTQGKWKIRCSKFFVCFCTVYEHKTSVVHWKLVSVRSLHWRQKRPSEFLW